MNQPDRYARFVLPEGKAKVEFATDTKMKHAATYTIRLEDHTIGNLLRMQLHADPHVVFAGYRIPHPLDPLMVVRIQTNERKTPEEAMDGAIRALKGEVAELKAQLQAACPRPVGDDAAAAAAGAAAMGMPPGMQQPGGMMQPMPMQQQQQFMPPPDPYGGGGGYGSGYQQMGGGGGGGGYLGGGGY